MPFETESDQPLQSETFTNEQYPEDLHPTPRRGGRPVWRGQSPSGPVPGAQLSPERRAKLREALRQINLAEMAVRGSDVIVYSRE